jgi:hypothetical protein
MWVWAIALAVGCHQDPPPAAPAAPEPRTPLGYLLGADSQLQLDTDQVARLKQLDAALAPRLAVLDQQIAVAMNAQDDSAVTPSTIPPWNGGAGGMGGAHGMGGGGMGSGAVAAGGGSAMSNGPGGGMSAAGGSGSNSGRFGVYGTEASAHDDHGDTLDHLLAERADDIRTALDVAFGALRPQQRVIARRVLADHDVDYDDADSRIERDVTPGATGSPSRSGR